MDESGLCLELAGGDLSVVFMNFARLGVKPELGSVGVVGSFFTLEAAGGSSG